MPVTAASSRDVTAINVLMNSFVLACKWSIVRYCYLFKLLPNPTLTLILILDPVQPTANSGITYI